MCQHYSEFSDGSTVQLLPFHHRKVSKYHSPILESQFAAYGMELQEVKERGANEHVCVPVDFRDLQDIDALWI